MHALTDADFNAAYGGFWIKDNGDVLPVETCGHSHALCTHTPFRFYIEAWAAGWIRVSTCGMHHTMDCEFTLPTVSVAALRQLAAILRHSRSAGFNIYELTREELDWQDPDYCVKFAGDENGANRCARKVMAYALEKNAAARAKQPELELAA